MSAVRKAANVAKVGGGLTLAYLMTIFVTRTEFAKLEKDCANAKFESVTMPEWLDKRKQIEEEIMKLRERVARLEPKAEIQWSTNGTVIGPERRVSPKRIPL